MNYIFPNKSVMQFFSARISTDNMAQKQHPSQTAKTTLLYVTQGKLPISKF